MKLSKKIAQLLTLTMFLVLCHGQLTAAESGSIMGRVYCDLDNNGICDCEEQGLKDISIKIFDRQCGGNALQTVHTDAEGNFSFQNFDEGTYFILVDLDYVCGGRVPTTKSCQQVRLPADETISLDPFGFSVLGQ
jgi:hypothetical protein